MLAVFYLTLFYQIGNFAFVGADEPRYARIAQEMNLRNSYVTPTLEFRPWLEKPPLLFWLEALSFKIFGVSEWSARFPVAICALTAALAVGVFAAGIAGSRAGFIAPLILTTSGLFFVYARAAGTDMPLLAAFTLALVATFEASRRGSNAMMLGGGAALGLATLAKGPVALVLFAAVYLIYALIVQAFPWNRIQSLLGLASFCCVSVPWYWLVWLENGANFVATFWLNHHLARFLTSVHHHSQPFWYYLPVLILGLFPWSFFLIAPAVRMVRRRRPAVGLNREEVFLWLWFVIPVLFFSLSNSKLPGYVLPVLPAAAVLAALEWDRLSRLDLHAHRWLRLQIGLVFGFGVVFSAAIVWGFSHVYDSWSVGAALAACLALGVSIAFYYFRKRRLDSSLLALVAAMTLFAAVGYWVAAPVLDGYHSARELSRRAFPALSKEQPLVLYRYFHHTALYYTDYRSTAEALPNRQALEAYAIEHPQVQYLILTQKPGWQDLRDEPATRLLMQEGNLYLVEWKPRS